MRRARTGYLLAALVTLAPLLSACESFDMDKFDIFGINEKKKLPGERKPLFPEGVPGVTQGIPPDLMKGNAPPPDAAAATASATPAAAPAPAGAAATTAAEPPVEKPKPKARAVVKRQPMLPKPQAQPKSQPAQVTVQPAAKGQQQQADPAWPSQGQQQQQTGTQAPWPSTAQQPSPWPSAPAPGTFQR